MILTMEGVAFPPIPDFYARRYVPFQFGDGNILCT